MTEQVPEALDATLRRLTAERDEQDALYNDALTALDRAQPGAVAFGAAPSPVDEHQVTPLNESWNILPAPPSAPGLRGRLAGFVWGLVGPYLERQLTFNSRLVDHVNRTVAAGRAAHAAQLETSAALERHLADIAVFHQRLLLYLQHVTGYVDTKDRDVGGRALVLNAAISGLAESSAKHWESHAARERRLESRVEALGAAGDELRAMIGVAQQAVLSIKRTLERAGETGGPPASPRPAPPDASGGVFAPLDAYKYVGFEDQFRGSQADIRRRLESYLPFFAGATDVLDVGCGRGEFLDLLAAHDIGARGLDSNHEMAELCRARGLDVAEADAVTFLSALPDGSLGGLFAAQVVEHLPPAYLLRLLELAFHKLRPGGRLVLETLNPACWVAFFESYIRDITHVWPLHPDTLKYLVSASGFPRVQVEYRSPVPPEDRLQTIAVESAERALADLAEAFNANVEKLNARMFTFLDYAVVAER